jgi:hypothetical protein
MHLRGTFHIVLALLLASERSPFAALFKRQFGPWANWFRARHGFPPNP